MIWQQGLDGHRAWSTSRSSLEILHTPSYHQISQGRHAPTSQCFAEVKLHSEAHYDCSTEHDDIHQSPLSLFSSGAVELTAQVFGQQGNVSLFSHSSYFRIGKLHPAQVLMPMYVFKAVIHVDRSVQSGDVWMQQIWSDHLQMTVRTDFRNKTDLSAFLSRPTGQPIFVTQHIR